MAHGGGSWKQALRGQKESSGSPALQAGHQEWPGSRGLRKGPAKQRGEPWTAPYRPHATPTCVTALCSQRRQDGEKCHSTEIRRPGSLAGLCVTMYPEQVPSALEDRAAGELHTSDTKSAFVPNQLITFQQGQKGVGGQALYSNSSLRRQNRTCLPC